MARDFSEIARFRTNLSTYLANFDEIDWKVKDKPKCKCGNLLECHECYLESVIQSETVIE